MAQNRHMFRPQMSLFIPSVTASTTEEQIQKVFESLHLGVVSRVDFVEKDGNNQKGKYMAFVHFEYWFINNSSYHLQERITTHGQGKIVYNDPYYWIVMENKNPRSEGEIILEKRVDELEKRVKYLETVIATHTRKFIENGITTKTYTCSGCWVTTLEECDTCDLCGENSQSLLVMDVTPDKSQNDADIFQSPQYNDRAFDEAAALAMTGALDTSNGAEVNNYTNDKPNNGGWWPWS